MSLVDFPVRSRIEGLRLTLCLVALVPVVSLTSAQSPPAAKSAPPRLEAVAETALLMEGIAHVNYRALEKMLRDPPRNLEAWTFARGQALLIAETGNLLMLRPPRNPSEELWMKHATELRETATILARKAAAQDAPGARSALQAMAGTCNRCHESFRIPRRLTPFEEPRK